MFPNAMQCKIEEYFFFSNTQQRVKINKVKKNIFTEWTLGWNQSITRYVRFLCVCPLSVTFHWRGIETSSQGGFSLNHQTSRTRITKPSGTLIAAEAA